MNVTFYPETHTYINDTTQEKYISCTTLLSKYKKPFDVDGHSKRIARREGVSQQFILDSWKDAADQGHLKGNTYHKIMENFIKDNTVESGYEDLIDNFAKKTAGIIINTSNVMSEQLLVLHDYRVAGTADLIVENKQNFAIFDFKTNKKFNFTSKYNEFLLEPVDYLTNCEFTVYALQLSLYAYMFEMKTGKKCASLKTFYLRDFSAKFWQEINIPYMKDSIEKLLNHYREQTSK